MTMEVKKESDSWGLDVCHQKETKKKQHLICNFDY